MFIYILFCLYLFKKIKGLFSSFEVLCTCFVTFHFTITFKWVEQNDTVFFFAFFFLFFIFCFLLFELYLLAPEVLLKSEISLLLWFRKWRLKVLIFSIYCWDNVGLSNLPLDFLNKIYIKKKTCFLKRKALVFEFFFLIFLFENKIYT